MKKYKLDCRKKTKLINLPSILPVPAITVAKESTRTLIHDSTVDLPKKMKNKKN